MRVYLSGPMSGLPDYNMPAFDEAAARWRKAGHLVYSPADIDRALGYREFTLIERRHVMGMDCITLAHTAEALALLPGWEHSRGCTVEVALAQYVGLPIHDAVTMEELVIPTKPWAPLLLEGGGERRLVDADGIRIIGPTSRRPADSCSYCSLDFRSNPLMERIQTLGYAGEITLCRSCYNEAGNTVR